MNGQATVTAGEVKRTQTRRIVVTGVLAAIAILLGVTRLGFIPVPTAAGNATIMHLPAVIGGVLEGPVVGGIIGLIFGLTSFFDATNPIFKDPLVAILPRIFIGIVAYLVYAGLSRARVPAWVSLPVTGFLGSATNTVLVLLMIYIRFHWTWQTVLSVAVVNGLPEAIVSAIITTAVVAAYLGISRRAVKSKIS
jgi:uncharacterized membrane protein